MVIVYMVLICIGAGVVLGLLRLLFNTISERNQQINTHFSRHKGRYLTLIGVLIIIAAAIYMANSTPNDNDDQGIMQYDNRGNPLDN